MAAEMKNCSCGSVAWTAGLRPRKALVRDPHCEVHGEFPVQPPPDPRIVLDTAKFDWRAIFRSLDGAKD